MAEQPLLSRIRANAARNSMDFSILPFHDEALGSILDLEIEAQSIPHMDFEKATRIDTHTHPIPQWFRALEPQAAGRETPTWNAAAHLDFMRSHEIGHSVLCVSTPQANAFNKDPGPLRKKKTIALARLLNEFVSKLCRLYPERFSFMAVLPLPHVEESLTELDYALGTLGAIGVGVLTNHEGMYPGDKKFKPIWQALQRRAEDAGAHEVVFIHPTEPTLLLEDGTLINSRPSPLRSGLGEFYFETARAISSITANRTILDFPNLHWRVSHGAGAFPDISERFLLGFPDIAPEAREVFKKRFWYDSAGPVWPDQIKGLTHTMKVPASQMVFGTDYPYGIGFWDVDANIRGLEDADFISGEDRAGVWRGNVLGLWGNRLGSRVSGEVRGGKKL